MSTSSSERTAIEGCLAMLIPGTFAASQPCPICGEHSGKLPCVHRKDTQLPLSALLTDREVDACVGGQPLDRKVCERALAKLLGMLSAVSEKKGMIVSEHELVAHILATKEPRHGALCFFAHVARRALRTRGAPTPGQRTQSGPSARGRVAPRISSQRKRMRVEGKETKCVVGTWCARDEDELCRAREMYESLVARKALAMHKKDASGMFNT
jgi:hypothetical protein